MSNRTLDFKSGSYFIELCLLLFSYDQWFNSYLERKYLRNFTFCVSAIVKQYPGLDFIYPQCKSNIIADQISNESLCCSNKYN